MNEKCKYCDYVSKCSRICEYNSILCKVQRSFPKVVDKSYEQLQQENKKQSDKIKEVLSLLENFNADQVCTHTTHLSNEIEKILRGVSE